MSKKLGYILAGGALVAALQWAVPAAYSAISAEESAKECPAATQCPLQKADKADCPLGGADQAEADL